MRGLPAIFVLGLCLFTPQSRAQDLATWTQLPDIQNTGNNATSNYSPLVITGSNAISVYADYQGNSGSEGNYFLRTGDFSKVSKTATKVIDAQTAIIDIPGTHRFIRTSAVAKAFGQFYAVLHVEDNYPPNPVTHLGSRPAWATSSDGINWTYHGWIQILNSQEVFPYSSDCPYGPGGCGQYPYTYSSSASLIVREDMPATLNNTVPTNNRFLIYEGNGYCPAPSRACTKLSLLYSADGVSWYFYRNPVTNEVADLWPAAAPVGPAGPNFVSSTKTPFGYHVIAGDDWGVNAHRHIWSENGLNFQVIEMSADTMGTSSKGTNLAYDPGTNLIHALTIGHHYTLPAQTYNSCPSTHSCPSTFCFDSEGGSSSCGPGLGTCSSIDYGFQFCSDGNPQAPFSCPAGQTVHLTTCPCTCLGNSCGTRTSLTCS
jgi:hypothetical protein